MCPEPGDDARHHPGRQPHTDLGDLDLQQVYRPGSLGYRSGAAIIHGSISAELKSSDWDQKQPRLSFRQTAR